MRSRQQRTSLRIFTLSLHLLGTRIGYTKGQLRELVDGYADLTEATFQRTFERDLSDLREAGLQVEVLGKWPDFRYRVAPSAFVRRGELSGSQVDLLLRAANMWGGLAPPELSRLSLKLSAHLDSHSVPEKSAPVSAKLEGAEHLAAILEALSLRQPLSFTYNSRKGSELRDVAPLSLLVRGSAVYLWAHDFNREARRFFRLSRVEGSMVLVAEPDCYDLPVAAPDSLGDHNFQIRPLLSVAEGAAPLVRMCCEKPLEVHDLPTGMAPTPGYQIMWGTPDDWDAWQRLVVENSPAVRALAPAPFAARIDYLFGCALDILGDADGK